MERIRADRRSLIIDGERKIILSGAVHYPRSTPAMWPKILRESKQAGLNCIETYVFWEGHEPEEGLYDFTGRFDLGHFLDCCRDEGLYAILRIGPYVCSEWNFGGLAWWLVTKPGMVTRTWNHPFMDAMERFVRVLIDQVGDRQYTRGGPVILAQMENEYANVDKRYGEDGQRYLAWTAELAHKAGVEVPLIMCEGASPDAIETLNGFSVWPRVSHLLAERPQQPALWTENWPGWYDVWGQPHHYRPAEDITYEVMRFVAAGGSGVNYYMWYGGTNFNRDAMYLGTTSYDFSAPIDEYGLPTTKSEQLKLMHQFLTGNQQALLEGDRPSPEILVPSATGSEADSVVSYPVLFQGHELNFVANSFLEPRRVSLRGVELDMPARSLAVLAGNTTGDLSLAYQSWAKPAVVITREMAPAGITLDWQMIEEPLPGTGPDAHRSFGLVTLPHNMLLDTRDRTDFGWYRTTINTTRARAVTLTTRAVDFLSAWVNRRYIGSTPETLKEDRPHRSDFNVSLTIPLQEGANDLLLLATALGMIKGDWMIDAPQSEEQKGIIAPVMLDDELAAGPWHFSAATWGERVKLHDPGTATLASWGALTGGAGPLRWYRTTFELTLEHFASGLPWALEIGALFKGTLWVNGHNIGRYWQQPSPKATPENPWQVGHVMLANEGDPPQRNYHIPADWLQAGLNTIVVLEERGALPEGCRLVRRK